MMALTSKYHRAGDDEKAAEKEGIVQIEKNMRQFQVSNDQVVNPLRVSPGPSFIEGDRYTGRISRAIENIDSPVPGCDAGLIESIKVRKFLLCHHQYRENFYTPVGYTKDHPAAPERFTV
jgi:hypothetical protein